MLRWRVAYWEAERVTMRVSADWVWHALPTERALWVDLVWGTEPWRQRLMGRDNFWLHEPARMFGLYNDPENRRPNIEHEIITAWRYDEHGSYPVRDPSRESGIVIPDGAHTIAGILLPDNVWEEVRHAQPLVLA